MIPKIFFAIVLILGGMIIVGLVRPFISAPQANSGPASDNIVKATLRTQNQTLGAVTVGVTPKTLVLDQPVVFTLAINTHSVDLNYEYTDIASLSDNTGHTYQAVEWTGDSGGHHLIGDLVYESLSSEATSVTLILSGIDNQSASFSWEI
jgi:hypothetical protein